jgi:predicted transcriptional regulator
MPRISEEKKEKISEQILSLLFSKYPGSLFTVEVAKNLARDEEFIKDMLFRLVNKDLIVKITKNPEGYSYKRRLRWRLSNKAQEAYSKLQ